MRCLLSVICQDKLFKTIFFLCLLLLKFDTQAMASFSDLELNGYVWTKFSTDMNKDNEYEDLYEWRDEFRLRAKGNLSECFDFLVSLDMDYIWYKNEDADEEIDPHLFEAYFTTHFSKFDFRLGKQIVRWGKTDEVSPVDNVNPQDMREFIVRNLEGRKIPIWMAKLDFYPNDNWEIEGIFIPFFKDDQIDFWGRDWALFNHTKTAIKQSVLPPSAKTLLLNSSVIYHKPSKNFKNTEWGLRVAGTVNKYDVAFSYLYTWSDMPVLKSDLFQNDFSLYAQSGLNTYLTHLNWNSIADPNIHALFYRTHIWGVEMETTWGDFGVRGELAYTKGTRFMNTNFRISKHDTLFYVLGVDYLSANNFYLNLQFSQQIIFNYCPIIFFKHINNGLHGRLSQDLLRGKFVPELEFYWNLSDRSYYLNPELKIHFVDNWILKTGLNIFEGNRDTLFGNFDNCDQIYFYVEYDF